MASAETARLIAELSLRDKLTGGLKKATAGVDKFDSRWSKTAGVVKKGLVVGGAAAAGFLAVNIKAGIDNLATLESAVTSVNGALAVAGKGWKTTGADIAAEANRIEASVGAAFDDKDIVAATASLIRYGRVSEANLKPAMQVMTDLAARTGSVESAAKLLGKALADPIKASSALRRAGVILTDAQQHQLAVLLRMTKGEREHYNQLKRSDKAAAEAYKASVTAQKAGKAQKYVLDQLAKATKGAAAASQGPFERSQKVLADVIEDSQKALAEGFLPVIEKVRDILTKELAKPGTLNAIRDFGKGLAGGLESLVDAAQKVPWGTIGDSLRIAGTGARAVFDAFTGLPPWVQTAVLTGWGLNKLSGGLFSNIVGDLAKGLVKGVLGINAGTVIVKAGTVTGAGGAPTGGAAAAGTAGKGLSTLGKVFLVGEAIGLVAAVNEVRQQVQDSATQQAQDLHSNLNQILANPNADRAALITALDGVNQGIRDLQADPLAVALVSGPALDELKAMKAALEKRLGPKPEQSPDAKDRSADAKKAITDVGLQVQRKGEQTTGSIDKMKSNLGTKLDSAKRGIDSTRSSVDIATGAVRTGAAMGAAATRAVAPPIVSAIYAARPITNVDVHVNATTVTKQVSVTQSYGQTTTSRDQWWKDG